MKTISVDYEHNCETWWDTARHVPGCPAKCLTLLDTGGRSTVEVDDATADAFCRWAERIDGWDERPFLEID